MRRCGMIRISVTAYCFEKCRRNSSSVIVGGRPRTKILDESILEVVWFCLAGGEGVWEVLIVQKKVVDSSLACCGPRRYVLVGRTYRCQHTITHAIPRNNHLPWLRKRRRSWTVSLRFRFGRTQLADRITNNSSDQVRRHG